LTVVGLAGIAGTLLYNIGAAEKNNSS